MKKCKECKKVIGISYEELVMGVKIEAKTTLFPKHRVTGICDGCYRKKV